ncbi:MAG: AraC family transcriptional regulator [Eubacteriales bacterium]|nr:AraC family transcriptional regulator [Eubacteriales bacterium]MDD3882125.1 AraC family transcriptional regulator [Eubacteriales bacterium]MDD4513230.1 AraC family transcriptional regulator [Eubacteriales bacterium]
MTVRDVIDLIGAESVVSGADLDREVTGGYACDMLSWVMANAEAGMAWSTVQAHMNVIAVAVLMELSCVILPEGVKLEPDALRKAEDEKIAVLATDKTAFEVSGILYGKGIR